ncbi:MAG: DUF3347 domain-containing protein [Bacteroidota bacterium]
MKRILFIVLLAVVAVALYFFVFKKEDAPEGPKQQPIAVKSHSTGFDKSVDSVLDAYGTIRDAFVDGDSIKAKSAAGAMVTLLGGLNLEELKKDTTGIFETAATFINDIKANAESMGRSQTITDMRHDFSDMSNNLYPFLKMVHYKGQTLYWQNCGMPFEESSSANWISAEAKIVNPYLGKNHPKYHASMLECGETQDSIIAK